MEYNLAKIILQILSLLLLIATIQFILLPTLTDGFRQRIFKLRRQLFLWMVDQQLNPQEPAYTHLRSTMNGLLRFAERLTLLRLLIHGSIFRDHTKIYTQSVEERLSRLKNPHLKDELMEFRTQLGQEIIHHTLLVSPLAWALGSIVAIGLFPIIGLFVLIKGARALVGILHASTIKMARNFSVQGVEAQAEALIVTS